MRLWISPLVDILWITFEGEVVDKLWIELSTGAHNQYYVKLVDSDRSGSSSDCLLLGEFSSPNPGYSVLSGMLLCCPNCYIQYMI